MAAISLLLMPSGVTNRTREEVIDPLLDSAVYSYLSRCSAPFSAMRTIVLSSELLRIRTAAAKDDAAKLLNRILDSAILGSLSHALMVDRTAFVFATGQSKPENRWTSRHRKTAFWNVLAAESWARLGKFKLARGCLQKAIVSYQGTQWKAIEATVNHLRLETMMIDKLVLSPVILAESSASGHISKLDFAGPSPSVKTSSLKQVLVAEQVDSGHRLATESYEA